jgi:hypothetical protein
MQSVGKPAIAFFIVCAPALFSEISAGQQVIPNFAPDPAAAWFPDRPTGDDFLPPDNGPGPVMSDPAHPYVPNGAGQPTDHVADLTNPILLPWAAAQMKKANDEVLAGKVPFQPRERCWPGGVPEFDVLHRAAPLYIVQSAKEVLLIQRGDPEIRHVFLNVPHSRNLKPTWNGESVGHYEGDELVVDTIGENDKTFVDNYRTPHTDRIHVVERWKLVNSGRTLQVAVMVDDPGAFTTPWRAIQRFRHFDEGGMLETICAENNLAYFGFDVAPLPQTAKPDF